MATPQFWIVRVCHLLILLSCGGASLRERPRSHRRLQHLSHAFQTVWIGNEIHTERLLEACQVFANDLKDTGPQAVRRDFCANLLKARALVVNNSKGRLHDSAKRNLGAALLYERDVMGIHDGKKLKDPSGAVGLLWMRRSLEFQTELYRGLIMGKRPKEAALTAYRSQLEPFHGPVLRQFYTTFFRNKMPTRDAMLRRLGGLSYTEHEEELVINDLVLLVQTWRPALDKWKAYFVELGMEDARRV
jgi:hypothetical protein